jgi:hypothetical protein
MGTLRYAGFDGAEHLDDMYIFDVDARRWEQLAPRGDAPAAASQHTCTMLDGGRLAVVGGETLTFKGSTQLGVSMFDVEACTWIGSAVPTEATVCRAAHSAARVGDKVCTRTMAILCDYSRCHRVA